MNQSSCSFLFMGDWAGNRYLGVTALDQDKGNQWLQLAVSLLNGTNPWDTPKKENHRLKLVQAGMGYMRICEFWGGYSHLVSG